MVFSTVSSLSLIVISTLFLIGRKGAFFGYNCEKGGSLLWFYIPVISKV